MASGTPIALSSLALSKNRFVHCTVPDDCDLAFLYTMMTFRVFCDAPKNFFLQFHETNIAMNTPEY